MELRHAGHADETLPSFGPVALKPLARSDWWQFAQLKTAKAQENLLATNLWLIAQTHYSPDTTPLGIWADAKPVGLMVVEWKPDSRFHEISAMMIADAEQRKGYGHAAMKAIAAHLSKDARSHEILIAHDADNPAAGSVYRKAGFAPCWERGGNVYLRIKLRDFDLLAINRGLQPQIEVFPPAEVNTSHPDQWRPPKRLLHEGGTGSEWVQPYSFAEYEWPWSSRAVHPAQVWKGAMRLRLKISLAPGSEHQEAAPISLGVVFGGPLLDCQNGTAKLRRGSNDLVFPFQEGGWEWRAGRSSLAEWGPFALEKVGPVQWMMLMLSGGGRKDSGTLRVESVAVE